MRHGLRQIVLGFVMAASGGTTALAQTGSPTSADPARPLTHSARGAALSAVPDENANVTNTTSDPDTTTAAQGEPEAPKRKRLQVGVALRTALTPGVDTTDTLKADILWRWRGKGSRTDDSWAFAYRMSSFSSQVSSAIGRTDMPVGDIKVRPLMIGVDYKMPRGKWQWAAGISAGWALNDIHTPGAYLERATAAAGAEDLWVDVHNSFVWGPRVKGWYDLNPRVSFVLESAYLAARPDLDVRAHGVVTTRRLNADALIFKAGIVYGIF